MVAGVSSDIIELLIKSVMTQTQALEIMKTGANVFLTGEPGAGKTYVVNQYVSYLRSQGVQPAITASTGIAATHIGGMTIHAWSGIQIKESLSKYDLDNIADNDRVAKRVSTSQVLVIDEVSMLGPGTLSMVDAVCRRIRKSREPFGGLQVVLVGDFFQLPPVRKRQHDGQAQTMEQGRFAFESPSWQSLDPVVCYLSEQHRQDDRDYLGLLSAIRRSGFNNSHRRLLESRAAHDTAELGQVTKFYSHNADVDRINSRMLSELPGRPQAFMMKGKGAKHLVETLAKGCLSPQRLELKEGAVVMFTKNDQKGRYVNGTIGKVLEFNDGGLPVVRTSDSRVIEVEPADWLMEDGFLQLAKITQLPLRLAWAVTIHKSQGMSLDVAAMDLSQVFEHGQGYVALSRVRRLSGLHLLGFCDMAVSVDPTISAKDAELRGSCESARVAFSSLDAEEMGRRQREFLKRCGASGKPAKADGKKAKGDTMLVTLELWNKGLSIGKIAQERGLVPGTVISHLEKLAAKGSVSCDDITRILPERLVRCYDEVIAAFNRSQGPGLAPVFTRLGGAYSYDDLRLCRLARMLTGSPV